MQIAERRSSKMRATAEDEEKSDNIQSAVLHSLQTRLFRTERAVPASHVADLGLETSKQLLLLLILLLVLLPFTTTTTTTATTAITTTITTITTRGSISHSPSEAEPSRSSHRSHG